jgi:hypothetical protein
MTRIEFDHYEAFEQFDKMQVIPPDESRQLAQCKAVNTLR